MLRRYRLEDLPHDAVAGLAVAAVAVPVGIAYAQLAGIEPAVGLYSSVLPLVAYAIFGTSPQLMVGPSAAMAALVGAATAPLAGGDAERLVSLSATLAFLVGMLCFGASALRLGRIADLLSRPILLGFLHGIAISVVLSQLGALFGFPLEAGGVLPRLFEFAGKLALTHGPTLAIGGGATALLVLTPRLLPRLPAPLLAIAATGLAVRVFDLERAGVATIGAVPAGVPALRMPDFPIELLPVLVAEAAGLALVSFSNMMLAARSFAVRNGYQVDADREAAALGAANLAAAFSQGFAVSGTNSRTAVADAAGGRTQATGLVAAVAIAAVLLFLTGPLHDVPIAAVAAVLIGAARSLFDRAALAALLRSDRRAFWLSILVTLAVVVTGALAALAIAVVLALLRSVWPQRAADSDSARSGPQA